MSNPGVISVIEFDMKLTEEYSSEFKITEDPNHHTKLTFFDFEPQIKKQIADLRTKHVKTEIPEPKANPDDENVQDVRPVSSTSPQQLIKDDEKKPEIRLLVRLEDKQFEKTFVDSLCFYVKRMLQQRNMEKYRQIAKNTQ